MFRKILFTLFFSCALLAHNSARSALVSYSFSQGGFDEGGTIMGTFAGEDLNGDNQLVGGPGIVNDLGEITAFDVAFSGNSLVPAFTLGFTDFQGIVYVLDGSTDINIFALNDSFRYNTGPITTSNVCSIGLDCANVDIFDQSTTAPNDTIATNYSSESVIISLLSGSGDPEPDSGGSVPVPATLWLLGLGMIGIRRMAIRHRMVYRTTDTV